ncbi:MAG: SO2930 family diheme c-type cytochrome [Pseudomonadota bacterium]
MRTFRAAFAGLIAGVMLATCDGKTSTVPDLDVILADRPAATLSAYRLFEDDGTPASGVVPYDLINPLFSDHADKHRLVYVPGEQYASYVADDVFEFPVGSVLIKGFSYPETGLVETRLLIHKPDGWAAYPYVWDEDHTDAEYRPIGARRTIETMDPDGLPLTVNYAVPNQNQCKTCHQTGDDISPIGPKARNLDHVGPNGVAQLADWTDRGILRGVPIAVHAVPSVELAEGDIAGRARAYLDINCAHCHKDGGSASNSGLWLEWTEENAVKLGIGKHPTAAGRGAGQHTFVVAAGAPEDSILIHRMASTEPGVAMPELGRTLIDEAGVAAVRLWIEELENAG